MTSLENKREQLAQLLRAKLKRSKTKPLSFAQQRLWFLNQLEPQSAAYNCPAALRLSGELDIDALNRSVGQMVQRHESLRTVFPARDGSPVQEIRETHSIETAFSDLTELPEAEREAAGETLAQEEAFRPFDLANGPLLRLRLVRLGERELLLLVTMHHIISDAWSVGIFVRELTELYTAQIEKRTAQLDELNLQYGDFAVWQREWLGGGVLDEQLAYWRKQLAGAARLDLPTDFLPSSQPSHAGASLAFEIPAVLTARLQDLSRQHSATLFMTLVAAFQILLSRYARQDDVTIGTVIANRRFQDTEHLIGFFVNQLVLRTDLSGNPSFRGLLGRVREVVIGAYDHQDVPFEKVVEDLTPGREAGRSPFFDVVFAMQNVEELSLELPKLRLTPVPTANQPAKWDLVFIVEERRGQVRGHIQYATEVFEQSRIVRLLKHYEALLASIAEDIERPISDLDFITEEERNLLTKWNSTAAGYPERQQFHQFFEEHAAGAPEAVALVCEGRTVSYRELNERANQLAHYLREQGVIPETRVGICVERSIDVVVGQLGILKAGAAYVPMDAEYPRERLQYMVADMGGGWVLTQERLEDRIAGVQGVGVLCLDGHWSEIAKRPVTNLPCLGSADNLAYVIYTSGSTGQPKGVMVSHRNLNNLAQWHKEAFGVGTDDRGSCVAGLGFDASVWEMWPYLAAGASLALPREAERRDPEQLQRWIVDAGVSVAFLPTALAEPLLSLKWPEGQGHLRTLLTGGDRLSRRQAPKSPFRFSNNYGPTEATVVATSGWVASEGTQLPSIGLPIGNTRIYVLDEQLQRAPLGIAGELYISGKGVSRGYLNRPGLTAERFIPDPFADEAGQRLYKTGDLVRYRANGELEFVGRADHQVKIRGFRVELGEIEAALRAQAGVREAVVVVRADESGDKRLAAYLVAETHTGQMALRDSLRLMLPEYMVPSAYVFLERLPLTANGKIDLQALPEPERDESASEAAPKTAQSAVQEIIAGIWSEVLKKNRVNASDNFFDIGGHSLMATQVVSRVRRTFEIELPLQALFEAPVLCMFAERAEQAMRTSTGSPVPAMKRADRGMDLPLSYAQQRLWFVDQLEPGSAAYNVPFGLRLTGELQSEALEKSLNEIARRHEILRTTFPARDGRPIQRIAESGAVPLTFIDLSGRDEEERERETAILARKEHCTGFDLSKGPLLRATLVKLAPQEHVLFATTHHIVSDGWSVSILIRELTALYDAYRKGEDSPLAELEHQYVDFAQFQREWLEGPALEQQLTYWRKQLAGMEPLQLPADYPRPQVFSYRGAGVEIGLGEELTEQLKQLSRREGVTLFMTLMAAFQAVLFRASEQKDVVVGTPLANRNQLETEALVGTFINELAIRSRFHRSTTFRTLLQQMRETTLSAYAHGDLPFERVVEELAPERTLSHAPLFSVVFALQNVPEEELRLGELEVRPFEIEQESVKTDLRLVLFNSGGQMKGVLSYAVDLFEKKTAERMARQFERMLQTMARNIEQPIATASLLSEVERRQLLEEWNPVTEGALDEDECIHKLFEAQAERTPTATAAVFEDQTLSYGELNRNANRLARYLQSLGVGPELRIAICMDRSLEMLVSVMGVLKAGGVYVPLDPHTPAERLAGMLEDAQAAVVLTQAPLRDQLPVYWAQIISVDEDWSSIAEQSGENPDSEIEPANLAYVIYTSGSTGKPKGAGIEHRQITQYTKAIIERLALRAGWTYGLISTFAADLGNTMLFPSLCAGGTLHVIAEQPGRDGNELRRYIAQHGELDCLKITPAHLRSLVVSGGRSILPRQRLVVGGEATAWEWAQEWQAQRPELQIWNHYGPTECTVGVCTYDVRKAASASTRRGNVPLGSALRHCLLYVLDQEGELAPVGVPGELYIGGKGVGRGYLERSDTTAEKFVPDCYSGGEGARLYRTGDRVRWSDSGDLEFLGRLDGQVKLRGYRIELGEIEHILNEHPRVRHSAAMIREDEPGDLKLVAYVLPTDTGTDETPDGLSRYQLPNGLNVAQQNKNETEYLYREIFENLVYFQHGIELPEGACVFDVGANIGMFTLFVAETCERARVYAFEPASGTFACLKSNGALAGSGQVRVFRIGLSNEEKDAEFSYYSRYSMMSGLRCYASAEEELETIRQTLRNQQEAGDTDAPQLLEHAAELLEGRFEAHVENCRLRRLSDVIREESVERIDLLKIDVQRAELDVLLGIEAEDWSKIQQVVMEVHDFAGRKTEGRLAQVIDLLEQHGLYAVAEQYGELRGTDRWNLYASRKPEEQREGLKRSRKDKQSAPEAAALASGELREYLQARVPEYMVPSAVVVLKQLPLTANGKVDRKALPAPEYQGSGREAVKPRTPVEEILAAIWSEVLK
ncbi:MAG TPA: amino acid adenylation domain-containing protein, partial [Bryobacteraceae bacterium]|nr:amino acid adenylation domain-containing protein [Bryobacteraceae bacterium]